MEVLLQNQSHEEFLVQDQSTVGQGDSLRAHE